MSEEVRKLLRREVRMSEEVRKRENDYYAGTMKDDYISRKAVLDMLDYECGSCADTGYIFSLPGIEARQTGKWILDGEFIDCSVCRREKWSRTPYEKLVKRFRFCPNCGADMRGDNDE